jgi:hypothetical protein
VPTECASSSNIWTISENSRQDLRHRSRHASAVEALHVKVDLMGKEYVAESLLEAFAAHDLSGKRACFHAPLSPATCVPNELRPPRLVWTSRLTAPWRPNIWRSRRATSGKPSRLHHLHQFLQCATRSKSPTAALRGIPVASIGPITTQTAHDLGIEVAAQAKVFNVEGLVAAVLAIVH